MLSWDQCQCHPHARGHWFNEQLICDGCKTDLGQHLKNPKDCPVFQKGFMSSSNSRHKSSVIPKYRVHWNSHRKNWTLLLRGVKQDQFTAGVAKNVTFIISKVRQAKCKASGIRDVHAWAQMEQQDLRILQFDKGSERHANELLNTDTKTALRKRIYYNFKKDDFFHLTSPMYTPLTEVKTLYFSPTGQLYLMGWRKRTR